MVRWRGLAIAGFVIGSLLGMAGTMGLAQQRENLCAFVRGKKCGIEAARKRGLVPTGLRAVFPKGATCPRVDEAFAIDYTQVRATTALHGGIDMPAPFGTPIIAAADGTVVHVQNDPVATYRGREVVIRHDPAQTGWPVVVYTQYSHFDRPLRLKKGQRVRQGDVLGVTGNSGRGPKPGVQSRKRRPAIHFGAMYAPTPNFKIARNTFVPADGRWMDPHALYRRDGLLDSHKLRKLPRSKKAVAVPVIYKDGRRSDPKARFVWPYRCKG